jgi:hypothetical protein
VIKNRYLGLTFVSGVVAELPPDPQGHRLSKTGFDTGFLPPNGFLQDCCSMTIGVFEFGENLKSLLIGLNINQDIKGFDFVFNTTNKKEKEGKSCKKT